MVAISIHELHEHTDLWVRKAAAREDVLITDNGHAVAKIVPIPPEPNTSNPFLTRKVLPGFADLQASLSGGTDSSKAVSEMRDER
ncbi:antitoxin Phd_YefM of type II toxin-antitoxin system [Roseimicrobium gellanilyticum]|uniref:Antitoxin Phd_YefM of type II toxin-antitoxin system n=1 Tax=Roseimicrobium gellanilyticum TaxID=748857 RepID=A0A366HKG2_9BACT|nr:antitoxin Phd_YefM of type II toxin-antitoxin system [Roseimicrobium gellanilyticum]